MQIMPPDRQPTFSSVPKKKAWVPIFVQFLWLSLAVTACIELPSNAWFLKIIMAILAIAPLYFFKMTLPFLVSGSMALEVDNNGIFIRKVGRTWMIPWDHVERIGFKPAMIAIGTSNWSYSFIVYRISGKSKTVAIPDAFSYSPKFIYSLLVNKKQKYSLQKRTNLKVICEDCAQSDIW